MQKNIYIKLLLTVIAIELGIMLFKNPTREVAYIEPAANTAAYLQTNYHNPVPNNYKADPIKVEIVGIDMSSWNMPYKSVLPVMLCEKASNLQMGVVSFPLPVKNE